LPLASALFRLDNLQRQLKSSAMMRCCSVVTTEN
jgi:hypothetical protein